MNKTEIEARIAKATDIEADTDVLAGDLAYAIGNRAELDKIRAMARENAITDVLCELLESLKNGESLADAIDTIHENF